ncbi:DUF1540 domain-containing protein [Clostridium sp. cel8]|jgi:hypothetical protein|uniref:DUF1540 domain-containing protein n=1 Tax=unclassified Clostridium TaxID=2614128 RepID=UPI0015F369CD|nr:DUF1540 domain-containing protein [Clostridium sp. cel8]MBA5850768.1 DUF1540 domain-containing protein [Clostridium sp. cel8]
MNNQKMNNINQGVRCVVDSCHYHMSGDHCCAKQIEVKPKNAHNAQETDCATFTPEN